MKILVLNSGSSSIKFQLFQIEHDNLKVIAKGAIEKIGLRSSSYIIQFGEKLLKQNITIDNHTQGLQIINKLLEQSKLIDNISELIGIGHRVVHGGERFYNSVVINERTIKEIKKLIPLAPLHNKANLQGIESAIKHFPHIPQIAVFDTAFHHNIPKLSCIYPIPYKYYEQNSIRKYGFHGISHRYIVQQCAKYLKKDSSKLNIISLHLGNGASVCAIKNGQSVETSMGFTPLDGLMMGTRSGSIDPAILIYMAKNLELDFEQIDDILNKQSGLQGICGISDMQEIEKNYDTDDMCKLAFDMFCYRIKKYIGEYYAVLGKVDCIVFTGGIGEHSAKVRYDTLTNLKHLGIKLSKEKNSAVSNKQLDVLHKKNSKVKILKISTNEELQIALEVQKLIR